MEKEIIGYIIGGFGTLTATATLTWLIASRTFSERLEASQKREEDYKEKVSRIPELEKTIADLQKQIALHDRRKQFKFNTCDGYYTLGDEKYCPICLNVKNIEMPLVTDNIQDGSTWRYHCSNCNKSFPPR